MNDFKQRVFGCKGNPRNDKIACVQCKKTEETFTKMNEERVCKGAGATIVSHQGVLDRK